MAKIISSLQGSIGILSRTSQLTNDGESGVSTYVELDDISTVAITGNYDDLINIPVDFNPTSHTHPISDIINLQTELDSKVDGVTGIGLVNINNIDSENPIISISGSKSEFNNAVTDGNFLFVGDVLDTPDATLTTKGILKLTGDLGGTADNPTTPTAIHKIGDEIKHGILTLSDGLKIVGNTTSTTATKVNVQENDGTINTKPLSELANYLEFASAVNLPVTGVAGKIYATKDTDKIYRWNGTFYSEFVGAKGDKGDQGIQGIQGLKGDTGAKGDTGSFNGDITADQVTETATRKFQTPTQNTFNDATSSIQGQLNSKENAFSKNTAFNKNFGTTVGTVAEGNDSRILNGQTAFSWGNHAGKYPLYNGTGASGDWGINVTGSATSAANWGGKPADFSANVGKVANIASYDSVLGFYRTATKDQVNTFLSPYSGQVWGLLGDSFAVLNIYQPDLENRLGIFTISDGVSGSCITGGTNFAQGDAIDRPPFTQRIDAMLANTSSGIILQGGSNDFYYQVHLGTINDVVNTTFYGALKEILLKCVNKVSPNNIRLITPTIRDNTFIGGSGRSLFLNQLAYVNAMKEVAQMYGVICIDLFSGSGFTYENLDVLTSDGVHPNSNGSLFYNNFLVNNFDTTSGNSNAPLNSPDLTGTPTAPTAPAGTNTTQIATTAFVLANATARPYKVWTGLVSQSGTSAPTAIVLENTLGGTITWGYNATGSYSGTLTGAFTTDKTAILILPRGASAGTPMVIVSSNPLNVNTITIVTQLANPTATSVNGYLIGNVVEIRVYN